MNQQTTYPLARPGAGLPPMELAVAKILFRLRLWTGNRAAFNRRFQQEREKIDQLIQGLSDNDGATRRLIRRLPGLEDSSRDWSVWMTLDHLRIVHLEAAHAVALLGEGITPDLQISTATVKPSPQVTRDVVDACKASCNKALATIAAVKNLHTSAQLAHPWFGPMDAFAWHALLGSHMGIHRKQIQRILAQRQ